MILRYLRTVMKKLFIPALLLCILSACNSKENITPGPSPEPEPEPEPEVVSKGAYKHVVIIGLDGAGAAFRDTNTPGCDAIFANQATTYTCRVGMPSMSAQGWGSILHGVLPEHHGRTNEIIEGKDKYDPNYPDPSYPASNPYPSIFKVVKQALPGAKLASYVEWNPINAGLVENGLDVEKATGSGDAEVFNKILTYLTSNDPTVLFVQFSSPDDIGESKGFGSDIYLATITTVDAYVGSIYSKLKQKGLLDDTLFIVTADHGGKGKTHGGPTDEERNVFLGVAGKTVASGTIVDAESRDVAAIAAYALGLDSPATWSGRVPAGVFKDVTEAPDHKDPGEEYRGHQTKPTPALSNMQSLLSGHNVVAYLPFDGGIADAYGKVTTTSSGTLSYPDAYFGKGVDLHNGYVTLMDVTVGTGSFSVACWLKADPMWPNKVNDPSLISNKNWQEGVYKGFILSYRGTRDLKFNVGDGSKNRMDYVRLLPTNFDTGWMHVILTVDRPNKKVRIYTDFIFEGEESVIPSTLASISFDSMPLNIGQDGTGVLEYSLPAVVDEFIMTSDVLSEADVAALKAYYE